jgi:quinol monooxygenase YgiN
VSYRLTVELNIKPGTAADFEAAAGAAIARVKAEDAGCEMYDLFKNVDSDTRYALIESWASKEELDAHGKSPAMAEMAKIGPYLDGPPVMHRYND